MKQKKRKFEQEAMLRQQAEEDVRAGATGSKRHADVLGEDLVKFAKKGSLQTNDDYLKQLGVTPNKLELHLGYWSERTEIISNKTVLRSFQRNQSIVVSRI